MAPGVQDSELDFKTLQWYTAAQFAVDDVDPEAAAFRKTVAELRALMPAEHAW